MEPKYPQVKAHDYCLYGTCIGAAYIYMTTCRASGHVSGRQNRIYYILHMYNCVFFIDHPVGVVQTYSDCGMHVPYVTQLFSRTLCRALSDFLDNNKNRVPAFSHDPIFLCIQLDHCYSLLRNGIKESTNRNICCFFTIMSFLLIYNHHLFTFA